MVDEFYETHIDQENHNRPIWIMQEGEEHKKFQDKIANHRILVLNNNHIHRGLIPLERLFEKDDIPLKSTLQPQLKEVEDYDIGTKEEPKIVKLSKYLPAQVKSKYVEFIKKYKDIFAWSCNDLRMYDTSVIEHKIPLKHDIKPFR